jgi:hypothetical protein
LDIVHAIYFNSATLYTTADASQPNSTQDTPLFAPLGIPEFDQETLDEISDFFMSIPEMAEGEVLPSAPPLEPAITPSSFEQEVLEWHQFLSQAAQSIAPSKCPVNYTTFPDSRRSVMQFRTKAASVKFVQRPTALYSTCHAINRLYS